MTGAVVLVLLVLVGAMTDDPKSFYESLKQPGTGSSCCDLSDCYETLVERRNGSWWALDEANQWRQIPDSIITDKKTDNEHGVLCTGSYSSIGISPDGLRPLLYCFTEPDMGV